MSNLSVELEAASRPKIVSLRLYLKRIDICIVIIAVTLEASDLIIVIIVGSDSAIMAQRPALLRVEGVHRDGAGYE